MTFTLAYEQAQEVKDALKRARDALGYGDIEMFGNENSNGNALYAMTKLWGLQKN